jgi:hypothetical protein
MRWAIAALFAVLAAGAPIRAAAGDLEKLVMPGPVIEGHAKIESDCTQCHAPFAGARQRDLCLVCHEDVAADLSARAGFHGRAVIGTTDCRSCHTEHKGRDADVVGLDPETFDHRQTDFALHGAHARVACTQCHAAGKPLRDARSDCIGCHRSDDPHSGRLGESCGDCHSDVSWAREARFDHSTTRFPLRGEHRDVACELCHPAQRYQGTDTRCAGCHAAGDVHRGRFGAKCDTCHRPEGWKELRFDHDRDTKFRLTGAHRDARCESCHTGDLYAQELGTKCNSCHERDDEHRGRNGPRCERCHTTQAWKQSRFDHDRDTKFALRGAHRDVGCDDCHTGGVGKQKLETDCRSCHASDDVHAGQLGRDCASCHSEVAFARDVLFDHDLARFPLLGLHAAVSCDQCHETQRFQDADERCVACHAADDAHEGRLGESCARCHDPNGWKLWRFDHARQTDFPLRGAHEKLRCESCHRERVHGAIELASNCISCHRGDDRHRGSFGRDCARCHDEASWRGARLLRSARPARGESS